MKTHTYLKTQFTTWPQQIFNLVVADGPQQAVLNVAISIGSGDPRGGAPRSLSGQPRITLTDAHTGKEVRFNFRFRPTKTNPT